MPQLTQEKLGRGFGEEKKEEEEEEKKEGDGTGKVEISARKKTLAVGKPCMIMF